MSRKMTGNTMWSIWLKLPPALLQEYKGDATLADT